jgi:pyruvate formate lyase activating enzyme
MHFTAFHPAWKMLDKPPTPIGIIKRARQIALKNGIRYAYTGNIIDIEGSNTYCHNCTKCIIERSGYTITSYNTPCAGVFKK